MKKLTTILFAMALGAMTPQMVRAANTDNRDAEFIRKAAESNLVEIQTAHIALQRSQNPQIRAFADKLVTEHVQANQQLQQIATAKGVDFPNSATTGKKHENQHLQNISPAKFDREVVDYWVKDHKEDIKEYDSAAKKAKDPQVKQYAAGQLPTLQQQLDSAKALKP